MRSLLVVFIVFILTTEVAAAQATRPDTLRVGTSLVDGSVLEAFQVTWLGTPWDSAGREGAPNTVEETVEVVVGEDGDGLLKFTQTWKDSLGATLFVTVRVAHRKTMAYRAFHTGQTPGGLAHLDFDGPGVKGFYSAKPETPLIEFSLRLDETPFATFGGLLFAAIRHERGASGVLPGFGWGGTTNPALRWLHYRVVGREMLAIPGSPSVSAWRIQTSRSPGSEVVYWVTDQAPYFVRAESRAANGSGRRFEIASWSVIQPE